MDSTLVELLDKDMLIPLVAIVLCSLTCIVAIIAASARSIAAARAREQTKRELAAYVAEGSLDPDKAVAMIEAGKKGSSCELT